MVGPDETPFGMQKAFLSSKSSYFRELWAQEEDEVLETIVRLPETPGNVFGLAQNFLYTGSVFSGIAPDALPGYDVLIATWKLGNKLGIEGLCDEALQAMTEVRRVTNSIPAPPLLVQVWEDTSEGSTIRKLLLTWAAEYIRSSPSRGEFSKSLPQEVLSDLVVIMSSLDSVPPKKEGNETPVDTSGQRKNVHYLHGDSEADRKGKAVKHRHSDAALGRPQQADKGKPGRKPGPRASLPIIKAPKVKRPSTHLSGNFQPTTEQKLEFCADLLNKMLSGPGRSILIIQGAIPVCRFSFLTRCTGFWTRLVGPFKEPVNPETDGVPDYFEKVTKPMDLGTIQDKMDRREYNDENEFATDVRQIFENCFTYWSKSDPIYATCEKFKKTFEERFSTMNKWVAKLDGEEAA